MKKRSEAPQITSKLRHNILKMPEEIYKCTGITIFGRRIKSIVFTTDLAIIRNCNADAVFAVYPFTAQQTISDAIIKASYIPVFCGVGGRTTQGQRCVDLAWDAESQGAMGVVLNAAVSNENVKMVAYAVEIPTIVTVTDKRADIEGRLKAGAAILNVAGGKKTAELVANIRKDYPNVPIIASGGNTNELIAKTIAAGANAITYTPPSTKELFKEIMEDYRKEK